MHGVVTHKLEVETWQSKVTPISLVCSIYYTELGKNLFCMNLIAGEMTNKYCHFDGKTIVKSFSFHSNSKKRKTGKNENIFCVCEVKSVFNFYN